MLIALIDVSVSSVSGKSGKADAEGEPVIFESVALKPPRLNAAEDFVSLPALSLTSATREEKVLAPPTIPPKPPPKPPPKLYKLEAVVVAGVEKEAPAAGVADGVGVERLPRPLRLRYSP